MQELISPAQRGCRLLVADDRSPRPEALPGRPELLRYLRIGHCVFITVLEDAAVERGRWRVLPLFLSVGCCSVCLCSTDRFVSVVLTGQSLAQR